MKWASAWSFYWAGHIVSKFMVWRLGTLLYPVYSYLMRTSLEIQGDSDKGPWEKVENESQ